MEESMYNRGERWVVKRTDQHHKDRLAYQSIVSSLHIGYTDLSMACKELSHVSVVSLPIDVDRVQHVRCQ